MTGLGVKDNLAFDLIVNCCDDVSLLAYECRSFLVPSSVGFEANVSR